MRFPRVQFTVRFTMVAVAGMAVSIWSAQTAFRWHLYQTRAAHHAAEGTKLRAELAPFLEFKREYGHFLGCGTFQFALVTDCERTEWHTRLHVKYQRASSRPWLPVAPDPPEP